jgi:hypothetical protein
MELVKLPVIVHLQSQDWNVSRMKRRRVLFNTV